MERQKGQNLHYPTWHWSKETVDSQQLKNQASRKINNPTSLLKVRGMYGPVFDLPECYDKKRKVYIVGTRTESRKHERQGNTPYERKLKKILPDLTGLVRVKFTVEAYGRKEVKISYRGSKTRMSREISNGNSHRFFNRRN